jgi:hypothetical protein
VRNKANSPPDGSSGVDCAKQTQFPRADRPAPGAGPAKQTQFGAAGPAGGRLCDIASMPRFGKQTQSRAARLASGAGFCETNPIGRGNRAKRTQFGGRPEPRRQKCAKQTQLPEAGHRGGVRPAAERDASFYFIQPLASGRLCGWATTATRVFLHSWLELIDYEK